MTQQYPVRKQRKAANRKRLVLAAQELFMLQGYEATTMEGIAERAGLHVQTLYRHFENKVMLAAAGDEEQLAHFRGAIRDEQRQDTTIQFWRNYMSRAVASATSKGGGRNFREVLHHYMGSPTISMYLMQTGQEYKDLLTESLQRDINIDDPRERGETARLIAITLWGVHEHVLARRERQDGFDLANEAVATIDRVERLYAQVLKNKPG